MTGITNLLLLAFTVCFATVVPAMKFLSAGSLSQPIEYMVVSALLANPFLVLIVAHLSFAKTVRQHLWLTLGNLLFWYPWEIMHFLLGWFKPGWYGVMIGSFMLTCMACTYLVAVFFLIPDLRQRCNRSKAAV